MTLDFLVIPNRNDRTETIISTKFHKHSKMQFTCNESKKRAAFDQSGMQTEAVWGQEALKCLGQEGNVFPTVTNIL